MQVIVNFGWEAVQVHVVHLLGVGLDRQANQLRVMLEQ